MKKYNLGFITATADVPHEGHFRLFEMCKDRCHNLIVGLTSDARAIQEKRRPLLTFEHRRSILIHCKHVDRVVDNDGDPKAVSWQKLRFDVLFSSDEYYRSSEFLTFEQECPGIPVIYIPRPLHQPFATTQIIKELHLRFHASTIIIAMGVAGPVTRQGFGPYQISKPIHYGEQDVGSGTKDIYGFYKYFDQLPRNYKSKTHAVQQNSPFPMIAGINSHREIIMNQHLRNKPWNTYVSHYTAYESNSFPEETKTETTTPYASLQEFAMHVADSRRNPACIVNLIQRDAGITLDEWCERHCTSAEQFGEKLEKVQKIIRELEHEGIVHSDIHPRNVLVNVKTGFVSLIDFGWVCARMFQLCTKEATQLELALASHFDLDHFMKSLEVFASTNKWLQQLTPLKEVVVQK